MGKIMTDIDTQIENWQKKLLDLGKRNRLVNFRETKRSTLRITQPNISTFYSKLVIKGNDLKFRFLEKYEFDEDDEDNKSENQNDITKEDINSNQVYKDQQATLRNLRYRAKTSIEEQGVNILFASFGLLNYKENKNSNDFFSAPLILVPVKILLESISSPFVLTTLDEEIVINPTLIYKLDHEFKIKFPDFEPEDNNLIGYLDEVERLVQSNSWNVNKQVNLGLFSFLKINIYKDIIKNKDVIKNHFLIQALVNKKSFSDVPEELINYDHDGKILPIDTFQVVDADSSQQDAILFAKKNISFVLQGPPGTGKSQTITNIIAEKLSEGKKVLFVSEKMAALDVVYKRLTQSNLDDFCLTLHSHHANKKQILNILRHSLSLNHISLVEEARRELNSLTKEREKLNSYVKDLHSQVSPLEKSIYQVNGELARLSSIKDVIFSLPEVREIDIETFGNFIYSLKELANTIGKMHEDYSTNPWRDCKLDSLNFDTRHQIESVSSSLLPKLNELKKEVETTDSILELSRKETIQSIADLIIILNFASTSKKIPASWIFNENIIELIELAETYKNYTKKYFEIKENLASKYKKEYFNLNSELVLNNFNTCLTKIKKLLNVEIYPSAENIINNLEKLINFSSKLINKIIEIKNIESQIKKIIDIRNMETFHDVIEVEELFGYLCKNPKPTEVWLEKERLPELKSLFYEAKENHEKVTSISQDVLKIFEKEIFDLDYKPMLKKFKTEYASLFRIFNAGYRKDKNTIRALSIDYKQKFSYGEIIVLLRTLQSYFKTNDWISENSERLKIFFGSYYKDFDTNWKELEDAILVFEKIISYYENNKNLELTKKGLLQIPDNVDHIQVIFNDLSSLGTENIIQEIEREFSKNDTLGYTDINKTKNELDILLGLLRKLQSSYNQILTHEIVESTFKEKIDNLLKLRELQNIIYKYRHANQDLKNKFQYFYHDIKTDWPLLVNSLNWAKNLLNLKNKYLLSNQFVNHICADNNAINFSKEKYELIKFLYSNLEKDFDWFINLFEPNDEFLKVELPFMISRIESCINNLTNLEEWVDYKNNKNKCNDIGLEDYIKQIELYKLPSNEIIQIFEKQFYRKWLDEVLLEFPAVKSFRGKNQEQTIEDFVNHDKQQLLIAQSRVKERLLANFPNWDSFTSASNELGILKRELNKQRRIMPIRKLFKEIPNLLMTIKPCLMMSPLSVSLFLESDDYNFDLVIFDEASQVRIEDAIGAIFRGKQVIIVGDSKQLPPTNFFWAGTSDTNFDYDDDDDDYYDGSDAFESVLDESVSVLPERTLRWHYRSRHEDLIAFSNARIYNQSLITFPSIIEKESNIGVEFVFVLDGIYDRGGSRTNEKEAIKVAKLVMEHYSKTPDRSLGVVTFSLAQANAIESALRKLRLENDVFESFFNDNSGENFFIKNLESVQGDERDTIIVSVGYAKDHNGVLSMNFGPLNRNGGLRRLNVVITRAKYNLKLVSSFQSADILLDNTENEGVRLLRSYLEYAQQGPKSLQNEIKYTNEIALESPFEESVYKFIVNHGYKVVTQVGCSGYRIDMAIKHPQIPGRFVLAIECDGASYHSARTARERDRLRQMVLEDIGWKFHRIWSTDWIKDPYNEGNKLLEIIKKSIETYQEPMSIKKNPMNNGDDLSKRKNSSSPNIFEIVIENDTNSDNPFNFQYYELVDPEKIFYKVNGDNFEKYNQVILEIVKAEYPIHKENLINRLLIFSESKRVTPTLKRQVESHINNYLSEDIVLKGDYIWLKGIKEVIVKIPKKGDLPRKIQHISREELSTAMCEIINHSFSIKKDDLFIATSRVFGFNRVGATIAKELEGSYKLLIKSKKIKESEGKITINKK